MLTVGPSLGFPPSIFLRFGSHNGVWHTPGRLTVVNLGSEPPNFLGLCLIDSSEHPGEG